MDYWQTIERLKQDWGMGTPLSDKLTREAIVELIDVIGETMDEQDAQWVEDFGLFIADGDGEIDIQKGKAVCEIRPSSSGKIVVNSVVMEPKQLYLTKEFYEAVKQEVKKWAMAV